MFDNELPEWVLNNNIPGFLTPADLKALYQLASSLSENSIIVEIGSLYGKSAVQLARSAPNSTINCFDFWQGWQIAPDDGITRINVLETFKSFTKDYTNIKAKQITHSPNGAEWGNQLVDMVFIDADHHNPADWEIIEYWMPKIKKGGILCGHDYDGRVDCEPAFPDVNENIDRLEKMLDQNVTTYNTLDIGGSSVWSFRV
jgi:predicted O-methyltransferase YrrM